jgi:hypothetical protein
MKVWIAKVLLLTMSRVWLRWLMPTSTPGDGRVFWREVGFGKDFREWEVRNVETYSKIFAWTPNLLNVESIDCTEIGDRTWKVTMNFRREILPPSYCDRLENGDCEA